MDNETAILSQDFWNRRDWLRQLWQQHQELWAALEYDDQRVLHSYYAPAKNLDGSELEAWLAILHGNKSCDPERAGVAFRLLKQAQAEAEAAGLLNAAGRYTVRPRQYIEVRQGKRLWRYGVAAIATPKFDVDKMVRAIIKLARQQLEEEDAAKSHREDDLTS